MSVPDLKEECAMLAIRMPMSSHARPGGETPQSAYLWSESTGPAQHSGRLDSRDHRDDGPVLGGLIVMLAVALPLWVVMITLLISLLW